MAMTELLVMHCFQLSEISHIFQMQDLIPESLKMQWKTVMQPC